MLSRVKIICTGIVQGIGFRPFVYQIATKFKLKGTVRNQGDAGVQIILEGEKENILKFIDSLKHDKPYLVRYEDFQIIWDKYIHEFPNFTIIKSSNQKIGGISYLPPDISICEECLEDMKKKSDSRFRYAFTSCTICGPRYTTITKLPYDRPNTTMDDFPLCENCMSEYTNPLDRRYHAQTTCCNLCGPKLSLHEKNGELIQSSDMFSEIRKLLSEGKIIAIKGIGGTHFMDCAVPPA